MQVYIIREVREGMDAIVGVYANESEANRDMHGLSCMNHDKVYSIEQHELK